MNAKLFMTKAGLILKEASPELLTGGGIILGIAALITACSKMKKAEAVHEDIKEEIEDIQNGEDQDTKEYAIACVKTVLKAFGRYLKVFWLPLLLEVLSICSIWYGHGIMVKRNADLASAAVILTQQLEKYRGRVRERIGEEAENELFYGATKRKVGESIEELENGKTKKHPIYEYEITDGAGGPFDFIFDRTNHNFQSTPGVNIGWLKMVLKSCQDIMESRATESSDGWYTMNEVYGQLGCDIPAESFRWGWRWSRRDATKRDYIDFGISDHYDPAVQAFIKGDEPVIPIHFNCHPIDVVNDLGLIRFFGA